MRLLFLLAALAGVGVSIALHGPLSSVPLLVSAGLSVVAVLVFVVGRRSREVTPWIVIDGSNVMYWDGDRPSLMTVRAVLRAVEGEGFVPLVWFDANAGYLTQGGYLRPEQFSRMLGLRRSQVMVAPKGVPADPLLLAEAVRIGARVITNDRFRDWAEVHPSVREAGFLVGGGVRDGVVALRLGEGVA